MNSSYMDDSEKRPDYIRAMLKEPPLILKDFHAEDVLEFLQSGKKKDFYQGETIREESGSMKYAYLIISGEVGIWRSNIQMVTYGKGIFLGEAFLFSKNLQTDKIAASEPSQLLRFSRPSTLKFFRGKPEKLFNIFTRNIIKTQQRKLNAVSQQLYRVKRNLLENSN